MVEAGINVLIVDDRDLVQWGLRFLLSQQAWVQDCRSARNAAGALELAERYEPHLAVVDLALGLDPELSIVWRLRVACPHLRALLTSPGGSLAAASARHLGASGCVSKSAGTAELVRAMRRVAHGGEYFGCAGERQISRLTVREHEVLELVASGLTNREIASKMQLASDTIKQHTQAVYRKLKARNRTEAVVLAERMGLLHALVPGGARDAI